MLSSSPSCSSSPKGVGGGGGGLNFNCLESTFSPRGSCVSSETEFVHHLIQQHLDLGSSPSSVLNSARKSIHAPPGSLQPLSQKQNLIPLSPSHQHFHLLMSSRQPYTLPPIESTSRQPCLENGLFQRKTIQPQTLDSPHSMIKEKLKIQLHDVQKSNSSLRQSTSADNFNPKPKQYTPNSARVRKTNEKDEWEYQPISPPTVSSSWVAQPKGNNEATATNGHRWNQRMDKKLRDLEFHYSGGPTRVCHMKYLNDPDTEVRLPFKIDAEMPTDIEIAKKPRDQKKKKKLEKTKIIEKKLAKSKIETQKALLEMEKKREQLEFLHRLASRSVD